MILWKTTIRHYTHHPWQIVLSIIGVMLGVAVVVAIDLANSSAQRAFEISTQSVTGKATHQITGGPLGVPEEVYVDLRTKSRLRTMAPIVKGHVHLIRGPVVGPKVKTEVVQLIGVDLFSEKPFRNHFDFTTSRLDYSRFIGERNSVIMAKSKAAELNVKIEDEIHIIVGGREQVMRVVGLIDHDNSASATAVDTMLFADISTAQEILGVQGYLSHIDLILPKDNSRLRLLNEIKELLPPNVSLATPGERSNAVSKMTDAFETNLIALSMLALVVGVFLIYNTMTFSVVLRRELIGILRTAGVTRMQIFRLVFLETLVIGVIATSAGIFFGIILANGLLSLVTRTINDLYFVLTVQSLDISVFSISKGVLMGIVATSIAGLVPAIEATRSSPRASLTRSTLEARYHDAIRWAYWLGGLMIFVGVLILFVPTRFLPLSFAGMFTIIVGFTLWVPRFTLSIVHTLVPLLSRMFGFIGSISARSVTTTLSRTGVAIASLAVALATTIGVAIMIDSFRDSVVTWLENSFSADVFVTALGVSNNEGRGTLNEIWVERFKNLSEVDNISVLRTVRVSAPKGLTELYVVQIPASAFTTFQIIDGDAGAARKAFFNDDAVMVSEPYAYHNNLKVGEMLALPTDSGLKTFRVAAIYTDYGSEHGIVAINRPTYERYWDDRSINSIGVYAKPGVSVDALMTRLRLLVDEYRSDPFKAAREQDLIISSNRALRDATINIFDRTFVVTEVLRILAILVAFVGVVSALMAIQFERKPEIALLRALGLTPQEVWLVVSGETGLIGMVAGILSIPLGFMLGFVLIYVINRRSFGWTMDLSIDPLIFGQSILLAVTAALIAGMYPAYKMSRDNPQGVLRED